MEHMDEDIFEENYLKGYEYETLMNALHVSVFKCLLNEEFTAIWCNNYFFDSTGYTKEEYISTYNYSIRDYFSCMPDEYGKIAAAVVEAFHQGQTGFECVSRMPQKSGKFIWIKVVGTFTEERRDGIPVLYVVYTDITDVIEQQELRKRLEERSEMLRVALDTAEEANRAKSDFLSRMSHDIRTPLNAIIGMTEIADTYLENPSKMHECHRKIALSGQHLLGLINDVLDMSKIESGKMTLNNDTVSLPELLENIVAIILPNMKLKRQNFIVCPHNILPEKVYSDALRLRQILLNILSNASKFTMEEGIIRFDIETISFGDDDTVLLRFTITDNGIGMKPEFVEHIFDAFTREQDSRVDKIVGSGLGMAITKRIVDKLGGEIKVTSQPGRGTVFQVILPLKPVDLPFETSDLSGLKILFADDDSIVCGYVKSVFGMLGLDCECVTGGYKAAVEVLEADRGSREYDVVILNWETSGLSGLQRGHWLEMKDDRPEPVLLVSAYDWAEIEDEARAAGAAGFLPRPLFASTICEGLRTYVIHQERAGRGHNLQGGFDFSGHRFLLAEDNELNREIAMELLSATGASLDYVCDGAQCVKRFSESPIGYYDLILMDVQMPSMNGYQATEEIRRLNREDAHTVQIWAMTADAFVEDIEMAKSVGMNGHFAKPLDITQVNREINRFLNIQPGFSG